MKVRVADQVGFEHIVITPETRDEAESLERWAEMSSKLKYVYEYKGESKLGLLLITRETNS